MDAKKPESEKHLITQEAVDAEKSQSEKQLTTEVAVEYLDSEVNYFGTVYTFNFTLVQCNKN